MSLSALTVSSHSNPAHHRPSLDDVRTVRYLLMIILPAELADEILDAARYWSKRTARRHDYMEAATRTPNKYITHVQRCYLITPPLDARAKMVIFRLKSCDQGWGGDGIPGTYEHAWSWFEAAILRPADLASSASSFIGSLTENPTDVSLHRDDEYDQSQWDELVQREVDGRTRWVVQRNAQASSEVRNHEVIWTSQDEDAYGYDVERERGCGKGKGFVRSISVGDRIAVVARASYPGWENRVHSVEVDIFVSV